MNIRPLIASALFFAASCFYHLLGFYALKINYKKRTNQLFFIMSVVSAIWTLSFSLAVNAVSREEALFWYKISTFGWGTFYSFLFNFYHALLCPTKKRGRLFYLLTYLPAVINIILFLALGDFSSSQFNIVSSSWGWTYLFPMNWVSAYLALYILVFFSSIVVLVYYWIKTSFKKDGILKYKKLDIYFMFFVLLFIIFDIFGRYQGITLINLMSVWMVMPAIRVFYLIKNKKFLDVKKVINSEVVIDDDARKKIFELIGYIYVLVAYMTFAIYYFGARTEAANLYVMSFIYYFGGIAHFAVCKIIVRSDHQYYFMTFFATICMLLSVVFHPADGGITIWTIYFFFIIITSLFDSPIHCYIITGAFVVAQLIYWYLLPEYGILLDWTDYLSRVLVIFSVWIIVQYINLLYYQKTHEYKYQKVIQETLTELSQNLLDINLDNYYSKFQYLLALWNNRFNYSDSYIFIFAEDKQSIKLVHHQSGGIYNGETAAGREDKHYILQDYLWVIGDIKNGNSIFIEDIELISDDAAEFKSVLRSNKVLGFYALPIIIGGDVGGLLYFEFNEVRDYILHYDYKKVLANLLSDSIQKIAFQRRLFKDANIDQVTGLYNRVYLTNKFKKIIAKSTKDQKHVLVVLDLDNFKNTNDVFGHFIGDKVLHKIGVELRSICSKRSLVARFGGDEFMIICPNSEGDEYTNKFVLEILNVFKAPFFIDNHEIQLSASIGVAVYPQDGSNMETLIKNADLAMYESKKMGKNRYHFCSDAAKRQTMENALYKDYLLNALQNNEFSLVYQPQINLSSGQITGAEALLRWDSPEFGAILPSKFIPILEHTGFIIEVGEWIVRSVIEQYLLIRETGRSDFSISINLSYVQLQNKKFCDRIAKILNSYDVDPAFLELEILEKDIISEHSDFSEILPKIKLLGCRIAIDDFGIEFSSLNQLQLLPVDRLKIDKSFIEGIGVDNKKESVVDVIIELANTFGFRSIAEGVETETQIDFLKRHRCENVQGYYYGRPLAAEAFIEFISDGVDLKQLSTDATRG